jgi:uncharacterized protein
MLKTDQIITINSRKFDGQIHRSWKAKFVEKQDSLLVFVGEFEEEVRHSKLGVIKRGTISYEYYWLDRWYNIFRFHEPDGDLRNYYCNLNMPPTLQNSILDYIDLDIDVLVSKDFSTEILDLDEFEEHSILYGYSNDLRTKALQTLDELLEMINQKKFPFS